MAMKKRKKVYEQKERESYRYAMPVLRGLCSRGAGDVYPFIYTYTRNIQQCYTYLRKAHHTHSHTSHVYNIYDNTHN